MGLAAVGALLAALPLAGGCVQSNHRMTIGDDIGLPAFQASVPGEPANDAPSLFSVTRAEWTPVVYHVPVDGVGHRPNYRTHWSSDDSLARARGEFPSATTALDLGQSGSESQTVEALIAPVNAIFDLASVPVLLFVEPQTLEMRSPYRRYQRAPRGSIMPGADCSTCDARCEGSACPTDSVSQVP